jgi:hypothetical protein
MSAKTKENTQANPTYNVVIMTELQVWNSCLMAVSFQT